MEVGPHRRRVCSGRGPVTGEAARSRAPWRDHRGPHAIRCTAKAGRSRRGALMALTRQDVRVVLDVYIRAWEGQDPDLIVTIFTENATYHERVLEAPIPNREAIRRY